MLDDEPNETDKLLVEESTKTTIPIVNQRTIGPRASLNAINNDQGRTTGPGASLNANNNDQGRTIGPGASLNANNNDQGRSSFGTSIEENIPMIDEICLSPSDNAKRVPISHSCQEVRNCLLHRGSYPSMPNSSHDSLRSSSHRFSLSPSGSTRNFQTAGPSNGIGMMASTPNYQKRQDPGSNQLFELSSDFMRVAGFGQQFKKLLQRKKSSERPSVSFAAGTLGKPTLKTCIQDIEGQTQPKTFLSIGDGEAKRKLIREASRVRQEENMAAARYRLKRRKELFYRRTKIGEIMLGFALIGVVLMIILNEFESYVPTFRRSWASLGLRICLLASTLALETLILNYHAVQIKLIMIDSGTDDWRVAVTTGRLCQIIVELLICGICPWPISGSLYWPYIQQTDFRSVKAAEISTDALLSIPMFARFYLVGRFMVSHNRLFEDAATRSIAALNRVSVDFQFVLKTLMHEEPLRVLITFTVCFWISMSWIYSLCERFSEPIHPKGYSYLNALWLVVITFLSVGYGDITPSTYCGRGIAICSGAMGIGVASALVAVISRKLELSRAEKHVNAFLADTKLARERKNTAASVLQETWYIHKYSHRSRDEMKLRWHQRRFLAAINDFRRVKWEQRKLAEQSNMLIDVAKIQSDMHETLYELQRNQQSMLAEIGIVHEYLKNIQSAIVAQKRRTSSSLYQL